MTISTSVQRLIDKYGQTFTLRYITPQDIDVDNPTISPEPVILNIEVRGYPSEYKSEEYNTLIKIGDLRLCIGEVDTEPSTEDKVVWKDDAWSIKGVNKTYINDIVVYYELHLRK